MSLIYGQQKILIERLRRQRFISHDADMRAFADLRGYAQSMARQGEILQLPDPAEAGAGEKVIELIEALEARENQSRSKTAVDLNLASQAAETNRLWADYNRDITWLREFEGRNRGEWRILTEWVGLTEADLIDPVPRAGEEGAEYGRRPDWNKCAGRVAEAVNKFRGLKPEERAAVPGIVAERRRTEVLKGHDQDIVNLRDVLSQMASATEALQQEVAALQQKVAALESRLPPQKEVTTAMVA